MTKHLPKKHSLHISWILSGVGLILGGMIIQAYLGTVFEVEKQNTGVVLGSAVGVSASVPANPDNTLAAQLRDRELSLNQREAELEFQELTIASQIRRERNRMLIYLLVGAIVVMGLVAFNFYLDYQYRHEHETKKKKKHFYSRLRA